MRSSMRRCSSRFARRRRAGRRVSISGGGGEIARGFYFAALGGGGESVRGVSLDTLLGKLTASTAGVAGALGPRVRARPGRFGRRHGAHASPRCAGQLARGRPRPFLPRLSHAAARGAQHVDDRHLLSPGSALLRRRIRRSPALPPGRVEAAEPCHAARNRTPPAGARTRATRHGARGRAAVVAPPSTHARRLVSYGRRGLVKYGGSAGARSPAAAAGRSVAGRPASAPFRDFVGDHLESPSALVHELVEPSAVRAHIARAFATGDFYAPACCSASSSHSAGLGPSHSGSKPLACRGSARPRTQPTIGHDERVDRSPEDGLADQAGAGRPRDGSPWADESRGRRATTGERARGQVPPGFGLPEAQGREPDRGRRRVPQDESPAGPEL